MTNEYTRLEMLVGSDAIKKLQDKKVVVFGVGGVGGNAIEALARSNIGQIDIVDHDTVSLTNINRQIVALHSTIGKKKVDVMKDRILDINPNIIVNTYPIFYSQETANEISLENYDYIIDAIDSVTAKLFLIEQATHLHIPIISAMGCGNRLDPSQLIVTDIFQTSGDPLARIMRKELRDRNIPHLLVVTSTEKPAKPLFQPDEAIEKRVIPSSSAFVPPAAGLLLASRVIQDLLLA